jgi:hypothetical protein
MTETPRTSSSKQLAALETKPAAAPIKHAYPDGRALQWSIHPLLAADELSTRLFWQLLIQLFGAGRDIIGEERETRISVVGTRFEKNKPCLFL